MLVLLIIFLLIQIPIAFYLIQPGFLLLLHYIKKLFSPYISPVNKEAKIRKDFDFAAIITAHEDTRFIKPLVDSLLKQEYTNYHIYVVADACDISDLTFDNQKVTLLKPEVDFHAKIKSIQFAVNRFIRAHDALIIFDSDNLAHPKYLAVLNKYFQQGFLAVQTQMLSKNIETVYARLDSIGHIYHSFLERKMRMELGLSGHILGLGIAVDLALYNEIMYKDRLGGFDKKLQADLVRRIPQIGYAEEAIVYDEKVDDGRTLEKQRTRWIFTYFHYLKSNWEILMAGINRFNFNLIYFGIISLRPPLFMVLASGFLFLIATYFVNPAWSIVWLSILLFYAISFILIILTQSRQKGMGKTLFFVPIFLFRQIKAMLRIRKAGKTFLKTQHSRVLFIEDVLNNEPN